MKYSDKIWKYFNFTTTGYHVNSTEDTVKYRKTGGTITGKEPGMYLTNLIMVGFLIMFPCIYSFIYASNSKNAEFSSMIAMFSCVVLPVVIAIINTFLFNSVYRDLEPSVKNKEVYKREMPSNLRPAHVYMLLYDGKIDSVSIATTILDLVDRGYLEILREKGNKEDFFSSEKMILKKTNKSTENLFKYEKQLINWFIDIYGDSIKVDNDQIKNALDTCLNVNPADMFEEFRAYVALSFPIQSFYQRLVGFEEKLDFMSVYTIKFGLSAVVAFLPIPYITAPIVAIIASGLLNQKVNYVLNQKGVDEKDNWLDLKKYLKDFTLIKERSMDDLALYNKYLTYSIVLGENYKALEEINEFFKENLYKAVSENITDENSSVVIGTGETLKYKMKIYKLTPQDIEEIEKDIEMELEKYKN